MLKFQIFLARVTALSCDQSNEKNVPQISAAIAMKSLFILEISVAYLTNGDTQRPMR